MKRKVTWIICLAILLATTAAADEITIPGVLPAITISPSPEKPTSADTVILQLSGTWPDTGVPEWFGVRVRSERFDDSDCIGCILIDMLLPDAMDCDAPAGAEKPTDWRADVTIGRLEAGGYRVLARLVGCATVGPYEPLGEIRVGKPAGVLGDGSADCLEPGALVVLMDRTLYGLGIGQVGVVICRDKPECAGAALVSFFLYDQGESDARDYAEAEPLSLPPASTRWVDARTTALGAPVNKCGTLCEGYYGDVLFTADDGLTYSLVGADMLSSPVGPACTFSFGDCVRVQGVLQLTGPRTLAADLYPAQDGDLYGAILTPYAPVPKADLTMSPAASE